VTANSAGAGLAGAFCRTEISLGFDKVDSKLVMGLYDLEFALFEKHKQGGRQVAVLALGTP
jgi:hypothetical protein